MVLEDLHVCQLRIAREFRNPIPIDAEDRADLIPRQVGQRVQMPRRLDDHFVDAVAGGRFEQFVSLCQRRIAPRRRGGITSAR